MITVISVSSIDFRGYMEDLYLVRIMFKDRDHTFYLNYDNLLECEVDIFENIGRCKKDFKIIEVTSFSDVVRCYIIDDFVEICIFEVPTFEDIGASNKWFRKIETTYGFISEVKF